MRLGWKKFYNFKNRNKIQTVTQFCCSKQRNTVKNLQKHTQIIKIYLRLGWFRLVNFANIKSFQTIVYFYVKAYCKILKICLKSDNF